MADMMTTRTARLSLAFAALMATFVTAPATSAERPSDKDVKQLIERIDHERDRFEDQLDGQLKNSIIREPGREVNVERYLDDLQENVGKLKDRYKPEYAASAEATTVLRQGSDIQRYTSTLPPNYDGASEWNRLSGSLTALAAAYGTAFPLPPGQQARRLNDKEVRNAAAGVAKSADRYKKELDSSLKKDKTVDKRRRLEAGCGEVGIHRRRWAARVRRGAGTAPARLGHAGRRAFKCVVACGADSVGIDRGRPRQGGAGVRPADSAPWSRTMLFAVE
jgi:hypothetical protein